MSTLYINLSARDPCPEPSELLAAAAPKPTDTRTAHSPAEAAGHFFPSLVAVVKTQNT